MDDTELQRQLSELKDTWRIPRDPPLDRIWQAVEAEAFPAGYSRRPGRWVRSWLPLAATLVLGFGLGQLLPLLRSERATLPALTADVAASAAHNDDQSLYVGIATDYLERVTALLVTLTDASRRGLSLDHSTAQARDLLATTRLLMDSPRARDQHLQDLLDDLELILAQIVRLPHKAAAPDVYLIDQTLDEREVLPRLRGLIAENTTSQP